MSSQHGMIAAQPCVKRAYAASLLATVILAFSPIRAHAQSKSEHTPRQLTPPLYVTVPIDPTAFKAGG